MSMRFVGGLQELGDREVGVIASTDQLARDGHVLEPTGINLDNYRRNPIVLWNHDPAQPVGVATAVGVEGRSLGAKIEFAPEGASAIADEICQLVKAGIVKGISIGFDALDSDPLDPSRPRGGQHITSADLLEVSFVSIPADTGAGVVARSFAGRPGAMSMLRSLPVVSRSAMRRALDQVGRSNAPHKPIGLMSPYERAAFYAEAQRARTMTAWAGSQASDAEKRERRRAELEQLQAIGESHISGRH
jgi:HK97 family phage prohead protease